MSEPQDENYESPVNIDDNYTVLDEIDDIADDVDAIAAAVNEDKSEVIDDEKETQESENTQVETQENNSLNTTELTEDNDESEGINNVETPRPTHPYVYIIETFKHSKDESEKTDDVSLKSLDDVPFHYINTKVAYLKMLQDLRTAKEIALEIFTTRSDFEGTICFLSISTRDADYCLDTLKLKNDILLLTEIFINPQVVKIIYDYNNMLASFQKKLHLYLVNIFDLEKAFELLSPPKYKTRLNKVIKDTLDLQRVNILFDMKQRPLADSDKEFVRFGSHYMVHLYYRFKNDLIDKGGDVYKDFLEECRDVSKIVFSDINVMMLSQIEKELKSRHECELYLLKKLDEWRNAYAQKYNMQTGQVMDKRSLICIVRNLPRDENELTQYSKSHFVKQYSSKIFEIIKEAKDKYKFHQFLPRKSKEQKKPPPQASPKPPQKRKPTGPRPSLKPLMKKQRLDDRIQAIINDTLKPWQRPSRSSGCSSGGPSPGFGQSGSSRNFNNSFGGSMNMGRPESYSSRMSRPEPFPNRMFRPLSPPAFSGNPNFRQNPRSGHFNNHRSY